MVEDKNTWLAKVSPNLLALSKAQDVKLALKEWAFSGKTEMHLTDDGFECQLSNHHDIGKSYEMRNGVTGNVLWVCSNCILRFYKDALKSWKPEGEIALEIEEKIADFHRKNRRKVTEPLMEIFPDVISQDFMFSRNDGYSAYDIFLFKTYAKLIGVPMDVSDFDISSRTDELRNSIDRIPKPLLDEIREALPVKWQNKLEDKFNKAASRHIQKQDSKL